VELLFTKKNTRKLNKIVREGLIAQCKCQMDSLEVVEGYVIGIIEIIELCLENLSSRVCRNPRRWLQRRKFSNIERR
jgi:hypothetical protein